MNSQRKGRLQLILLALVFALPVAAVVVLHGLIGGLLVKATVNWFSRRTN